MNGIRIGSVFGVEIRLDFSWFIIFFLILWSFTAAVFPLNAPGLSTGTYLIMGVSGTLLFFGSLLAHELSHALVARRRGVPIAGITLFIFGGMAMTRGEAETPGDEFAIAGVGPLASVLIALLLALLAGLGGQVGSPASALTVLRYTAALNIALAIFNLLPGFPLDGGRLLRAAIWKYTGDVRRATKAAATGGRWLAYALITFGVLQMFLRNAVGGLWLVFIGWFLRNAAISSYQQHEVMSMLEGVRAHQAMTPRPETVIPELTIARLLDEYFMQRRFMSYPVVGSDGLRGLITFLQARSIEADRRTQTRVSEVMTPVTADLLVQPDDAMTIVLERMQRSPARRVLVVQNGTLLGIITAADVTGWLERMQRREER